MEHKASSTEFWERKTIEIFAWGSLNQYLTLLDIHLFIITVNANMTEVLLPFLAGRAVVTKVSSGQALVSSGRVILTKLTTASAPNTKSKR